MTHDPLCHNPEPMPDGMACGWCWMIVRVRADERRWVTTSAGKELLNHKVTDGVCACGINAPDALEHLAWVVSVYVLHDLKPEHEAKSLT